RALEAEKALLANKATVEPVGPSDAQSDAQSTADVHAAPSSPDSEHESAGAQQASQGMSMGLEGPRLQMRGYADVRYTASNLAGSTNSFGLGQFDLFITSRLSDRLSVLGGVVTEAESGTNEFGIELERLLLNYHHSDFFNVGFGRYHTAI